MTETGEQIYSKAVSFIDAEYEALEGCTVDDLFEHIDCTYPELGVTKSMAVRLHKEYFE